MLGHRLEIPGQNPAVYMNFQGLIFHRRQGFHSLFFADHQVEYFISLSQCMFSRNQISHLASLQ